MSIDDSVEIKLNHIAFISSLACLLISCTKKETLVVNNNQVPKYKEVSTLMVENYINRLFIDLLGREATLSEREGLVKRLRFGKLSFSSRDSIVKMLQFDSTYRMGDSSYRKAYSTRMYLIAKARFLEGAADMDIAQRSSNLNFAITVYQLNGDSVNMFACRDQKKFFDRVLKSNYWFSRNSITYNKFLSYMLNNGIYDMINMGSFNYVNATFDDVFNRKPSIDEFNRAYAIIEKNIPTDIFNKVISNKNEYCEAITESSGFYEAEIRWWYFQYLRHEINSATLFPILNTFLKDHSIENAQRKILITDEYAQF